MARITNNRRNVRHTQNSWSSFRRLIDWLTLSAAVIEPLITVPQVVTIVVHHTAAGVSLSAWIGYDLLTTVWLFYAYFHKISALLIESSLFMMVQTAVIVAGLMYGAPW